MADPALPPDRAELVVIGGGVQGAATALMAAEAGRRVVLLEAGRFGGATSAAWFGILHGGLRYLQSLDIARLRASAAERRWWLARFPEATRTQPFLMPLYGAGLKRPAAFRAAFLAEAALTPGLRRGIAPGRVLSAAETAKDPLVRPEGLRGGALWEEAVERAPGALLGSLIAAARAAGAECREGVSAARLIVEGGRVAGVETGEGAALRAPVVIDAAGPWAGRLAAEAGDVEARELFRPALGFNLVLDRPGPAGPALSVAPPGGGPMLFLRSGSDGRLFAGTWYVPAAPASAPSAPVAAPAAAVAAFIEALNAACPGLDAAPGHVLAAPAGLLPAAASEGTDLLDRDILRDHGRAGGTQGLFTAIGVKFTTARRLAARVLRAAGLV